ncbi:TorF family putative porin [Undibacterium sp. TS12]|uniref:TorF family putative porin n=1 Tax=Undibacterium sp. TS12 TaxID=2908202 RepID=UPI001F4CB4A4|nr:TorF family putative porin [Undibacterium sp. TS12]MCH8621469.1 TorF family putative porin [Undibacterium sp. TS12]
MKKLILAMAVSTVFAGGFAQAEETKPDHEVSFNAALASDYRYRGISQTRLQAALQGGADYTHNPSGFYAGTWMSTIKWTKDAGGGGDVEIDLYAGKRGEMTKDLGYDVGVLSYVYPSNGLPVSANTTEIYGQLSYGPAYAKYSHSVTNLFGFADSKNSGYLDLGANVEISTGLTLNLHAGHQQVKNNGAYSYTDWKVGLTKDFGIVTGAAAIIGTNAGEVAYASPANGKFLGKTALVVTVSKTF